MDIASRNIEEVTTARWVVMRGYKNEKRAEEKLKGKDGLEYFVLFLQYLVCLDFYMSLYFIILMEVFKMGDEKFINKCKEIVRKYEMDH